MSAPSRAAIENAISRRVGYEAATDADVPGREGSTASQIATYDQATLGFRVIVANGNRYTKTSMTPYGLGGRITQEDAGGGSAGVDAIYDCAPSVTVGKTVYLSASNTVALANATDQTKGVAIGIVTAKPTTTTCVVRSYGQVSATGLTPGATYYLDTTDGLVTATPPTGVNDVVQPIGVAVTATSLLVQCDRQTNLRPNGSESALAYGFASSPGTGMYLQSPDAIGLAAAGALVATVSVNGLGVLVTDGSTSTTSTVASFIHETSGTPAAGIAADAAFLVEGAAGRVLAGTIGGALTVVTAGVEVGVIDILPAYSDSRSPAGLRVTSARGASGVLDVGVAVFPAPQATATIRGAAIRPYSSDPAVTNANLSLAALGTGALNLRDSGNTFTVFGIQGVGSGNISLAARSATDTSGANPTTLNTPTGVVRILSGSSSLVVANDLVSTSSHVWCNIRSTTNNPVYIAGVVPGAGTFSILLSGDPGASNCDLDFLVINPAA